MRRFIMLVERGLDVVNVLVGALMAASIALIFLLLAAQVLFRYLLFAPFNWVEEGATYLMAMLTLLGASLLLRQNVHLQVDLFQASAPRIVGVLLRLAALLATAVLAYYLMLGGWDYAVAGRGQLSPSGSFVVFWPRLTIPVGAGLLLVQALFMAVRLFLPGLDASDGKSNS